MVIPCHVDVVRIVMQPTTKRSSEGEETGTNGGDVVAPPTAAGDIHSSGSRDGPIDRQCTALAYRHSYVYRLQRRHDDLE